MITQGGTEARLIIGQTDIQLHDIQLCDIQLRDIQL